nr:hypothetical protein Iba_chr11dCG9890 [Ipomoea batatas]GME16091.1 hypothetical protein Iba_scaffold17071CG0010 [Ipomoea batatas]
MPTFAITAIRWSELPERKQERSLFAPRSLHSPPPLLHSEIRMSDSDSQNVSGQDYDEGDEGGHGSFSPSMGGSTFNQIDEVEHVSANTEENEGPLRTTTTPKDVSTSGRGKSPRVVVSALFPHLRPRTVEDVASSLRRGGAPRELRASKRISGLEASSRPHALPAPGEASSSTPSLPQPSALPAPAVASSSAPEPSEAEPADAATSTTRKKMLFLNSEVVQQQKCLLTRTETDEIHALLRGRIPYKVKKKQREREEEPATATAGLPPPQLPPPRTAVVDPLQLRRQPPAAIRLGLPCLRCRNCCNSIDPMQRRPPTSTRRPRLRSAGQEREREGHHCNSIDRLQQLHRLRAGHHCLVSVAATNRCFASVGHRYNRYLASATIATIVAGVMRSPIHTSKTER